MAHEDDAITLDVDEETARMLERFRGLLQAEMRDAITAADLLERTTFRALEHQLSDVERNQSKGTQAFTRRLEELEGQFSGFLTSLKATLGEVAVAQGGTRQELETVAVTLDSRVSDLGGRIEAGTGALEARVEGLSGRLDNLERSLAGVSTAQVELRAELARLHEITADQNRTERVPGFAPWLIGQRATAWLIERVGGGHAGCGPDRKRNWTGFPRWSSP